jgi:protocatechuate 3,4-dioxygenase beta subunit
MKRFVFTISVTFIISIILTAQQNSGVIKGRVYNSKSNEGVPFATVVVWGTNTGAMTDFDGNFLFTGIKPGFVELRVSSML